MTRLDTSDRPATPPLVRDELAWELLRDEWDLLLAVGNGPTPVDALADKLGASRDALLERLVLLHDHGLLHRQGDAFGLKSAVHVRQEGMSSFLRDLVIRRLQLGNEVPYAVGYRDNLGDHSAMKRFVASAEDGLFPSVFDRLQAPAGDDEPAGVTFIFAAASEPPAAEDPSAEASDLEGFMSVLKGAATERSQEATRDGADLKLADTRNSMADVDRVVALCDDFLANATTQQGPGAAAYALLLRPVN